jgi:selenocysteine lyase/cysteine desulfurase
MVAELAGVGEDEIALTRNSSEALEIAQLGLNLKPGDEVLTTNQDYPRMLTTYQQRERRDGIKLKTISFPVPAVSHDDLYQRFEQAVTPQTKVIHFCHITNRTGLIFPVRRICDMAQSRGITTIVDGAHAFSQFPFRVSDFNCDFYGVSLHKWTFAPVGTGFLYVRKSRIKDTWPLMASGVRQDASVRKFEGIGTYPAANFLAICEAITECSDSTGPTLISWALRRNSENRPFGGASTIGRVRALRRRVGAARPPRPVGRQNPRRCSSFPVRAGQLPAPEAPRG